MRLTALLLVSVCVIIIVADSSRADTVISQDFAVEPSNWTGYHNLPSDMYGANFGFSNTNNAGDTAGEMGGMVPQRGNGLIYYGDTTVGQNGNLSEKNSLTGTGLFTLTSQTNSTDGGMYFGWFDNTDPANHAEMIGVNINSSGTIYWWRPYVRTSAGVYTAGYTENPFVLDTDYTFELTYDPNAGGPGSGSLIIEFRDAGTDALLDTKTVTEIPSSAATLDLNTFGMWSYVYSSTSSQAFYVYMDDLTYSSNVPEPSTITLLLMVLSSLCIYRVR